MRPGKSDGWGGFGVRLRDAGRAPAMPFPAITSQNKSSAKYRGDDVVTVVTL